MVDISVYVWPVVSGIESDPYSEILIRAGGGDGDDGARNQWSCLRLCSCHPGYTGTTTDGLYVPVLLGYCVKLMDKSSWNCLCLCILMLKVQYSIEDYSPVHSMGSYIYSYHQFLISFEFFSRVLISFSKFDLSLTQLVVYPAQCLYNTTYTHTVQP